MVLDPGDTHVRCTHMIGPFSIPARKSPLYFSVGEREEGMLGGNPTDEGVDWGILPISPPIGVDF